MFIKTLASLLALASIAAAETPEKRLSCAEASRYGIANITPNTNLKSGDVWPLPPSRSNNLTIFSL